MADKNTIPAHVAIIMDGNGRWAKGRGLPRTAGHQEGIKRAKEIIKASAELGIQVLTLFAFSSENWNRPKGEINMLMRSLKYFLDTEVSSLHKNNIRFKTIGQRDQFPRAIVERIERAEAKTSTNSGLLLVLALNYGSRQEIVDAVKQVARSASEGTLELKELDEATFSRFLYTAGLPDPDLLIRTSGEQRISNFLLWQLSYTELYFPKKYWPDFKRLDLEKAIDVFRQRERRFGGI